MTLSNDDESENGHGVVKKSSRAPRPSQPVTPMCTNAGEDSDDPTAAVRSPNSIRSPHVRKSESAEKRATRESLSPDQQQAIRVKDTTARQGARKHLDFSDEESADAIRATNRAEHRRARANQPKPIINAQTSGSIYSTEPPTAAQLRYFDSSKVLGGKDLSEHPHLAEDGSGPVIAALLKFHVDSGNHRQQDTTVLAPRGPSGVAGDGEADHGPDGSDVDHDRVDRDNDDHGDVAAAAAAAAAAASANRPNLIAEVEHERVTPERTKNLFQQYQQQVGTFEEDSLHACGSCGKAAGFGNFGPYVEHNVEALSILQLSDDELRNYHQCSPEKQSIMSITKLPAAGDGVSNSMMMDSDDVKFYWLHPELVFQVSPLQPSVLPSPTCLTARLY